jgi:hypothetical protein
MSESDDKKAQVDSETILMTLDQIGQTIDIMTNVVGRLRGYITEQTEHAAKTNQHEETEIPTPYVEQSQTIH